MDASTTHPVTLCTALGVLLLVALDADDVLVTWHKTFAADWLSTLLAAETVLVPLLAHVLVLLHTCAEYMLSRD